MKGYIILFFTTTFILGYGQNQIDFRGMPSFSADYKLSQRIALTGIGNGIFTNDFHELGFAFSDVGLRYRIHKNLGINSNYRLLYKRNIDNSAAFRSIYYFDIDISKTRSRFQYGGTIRTQLTDFPAEKTLDFLIYNRTKVNVKYRYNYYLHPIFEVEVFTPLNHPTRKQIDQFRTLIGFQYVWNEKLKMEAFFQYRQQINRYPKNTIFLGAVNLIYRL